MEVVLREVQSPGTSTNTANQPRIQQTAQNQRQTQSEMFPPTTPSSIGSLVPFHEYKPCRRKLWPNQREKQAEAKLRGRKSVAREPVKANENDARIC
ncbi:hypothetical protein EVAR_101540_1 [Eumeta japonica]|uniref:Uncharacterized protein n=1 Tax=Eumeta variegata TaxID=151549 RepID=A0A4C1SSA5_EUMVA|nr:hypothetical protein EVAR_101540_1 [Eumeta japonica]